LFNTIHFFGIGHPKLNKQSITGAFEFFSKNHPAVPWPATGVDITSFYNRPNNLFYTFVGYGVFILSSSIGQDDPPITNINFSGWLSYSYITQEITFENFDFLCYNPSLPLKMNKSAQTGARNAPV